MRVIRTHRLAMLPVAGAVMVLFVGCGDPAESTVTTPVEPRDTPWADQIAALRAGDATAIEFGHTPVTSEQWAMLAEGCGALERLEAHVRLLVPDDFYVLADLPNLHQIKLLGPVDDAGIERIAKVASLRNLNLPEAEFTDNGLEALRALQHLELLRFNSPHVTDEGMAVIATLPELRFLHLIDVPVTDTGLSHLHGLTGLESFYLDGDRCTDEGLRDLLEALPKLHFHRNQLHLPDDPHAHPHSDTPSL